VTLTLHTASCSVHVPAALREHQRPIVDALLDAHAQCGVPHSWAKDGAA
jgi:hypothetical protein